MATNILKLPLQSRKLTLVHDSVDSEKRTARFSFSSDKPYKRYFGYETLDHSKNAMVTERLDAKAVPYLMDHNWEKTIGKVVGYATEAGKAYADVKMSRSALAAEALQDMADGIKTEISVGYIVHEMTKLNAEDRHIKDDEDTDEFLVTKWEPMEVSLVSVPADYTVGIGRAEGQTTYDALVQGIMDAKPNAPEDSDNDADNDLDTSPDADDTENLSANTTEVVEKNTEVIIPSTTIHMADPVITPTVDIVSEVNKVREQDLSRVREINAIGAKYDAVNDAIKFINDNKSVDEFKSFLLEKSIVKVGEPSFRQMDTTLGLTGKEQKKYNLCKAILESAYGDRKVTGFEKECSEELAARIGMPPTGFFVPDFALSTMGRADLQATVNATGEYTIQTSVEPSLIPLLRNKMVVGRAGATMMGGLVGNLELPRQITAATATWNSENNDPTRTNQTFDQVSLSPQRLSAVTAFSKQLLAQSQLDVQMIVRDDLLKIIAIAQDKAALAGSGASNQPTGILTTTADTVYPSAYGKTAPSVVLGSTSGYPTWTNLVAFEGNVEANNVDLDDASCAYLVSPQVKALWKTLSKNDPRATTQYFPEFLMEDVGIATDGRSGTINGYKAFATNQLAASALTSGVNQVIFGKFSDLIIATWGGLDLITDPYTLASAFQVRIIVNLLTTIALRYGPAFCYSSNGGLYNGA